ncbi:MAG TPA: hypothetical protein VNT81_08075 [Vicinamibacterales bacterium]|nr:hypothetical protein [Vicinamibacterales bacterium]
MPINFRTAGLALALSVSGVSAVFAQASLNEVMTRHGVLAKDGLAAAFDAHAAPTIPVTPGSLATSLAALTATTGNERIAGAYAFGILAGRSGRAASAPELTAAGQSLVIMIGSDDRKTRIAGARVAGRLFAAPFDRSGVRAPLPAGLVEALFALLNSDNEVDQLVAMDALGLLRERTAASSLTDRYYYYREQNKRSLAGGALEAIARIGDGQAAAIVKQAAADKFAEGKDATALAVAFARERLLKDGSIVTLQRALEEKSRRDQARGYLIELGASVP